MTKKSAPPPAAADEPVEEDATHEIMRLTADEIPFATDGLSAPTFYADTIRGTTIAWGVAKLNLIDHRMDAITNEVKAVHVMTLIIPARQMKSWGEFLVRNAPFAEEVEAFGEPQDG